VEFECSPADADGMFDVLTYQKGASLLRARAVPRRRSLPPGRQPTCAPRLGAPNRRPVGRDRGHRRAGAPADGLVDLAARLPARRRSPRWCRRRAHPAAVRLRRTDDHVVAGAVLVRSGDESQRVLGRFGAADARDPSAPVVVNAGGAVFRVSYDDELRARLTGATLADSTLELRPRRRCVERGGGRAPRGRGVPVVVEGFGAGTISPCGKRSCSACASLGRARRRRLPTLRRASPTSCGRSW
jgi:hypothetical protein